MFNQFRQAILGPILQGILEKNPMPQMGKIGGSTAQAPSFREALQKRNPVVGGMGQQMMGRPQESPTRQVQQRQMPPMPQFQPRGVPSMPQAPRNMPVPPMMRDLREGANMLMNPILRRPVGNMPGKPPISGQPQNGMQQPMVLGAQAPNQFQSAVATDSAQPNRNLFEMIAAILGMQKGTKGAKKSKKSPSDWFFESVLKGQPVEAVEPLR